METDGVTFGLPLPGDGGLPFVPATAAAVTEEAASPAPSAEATDAFVAGLLEALREHAAVHTTHPEDFLVKGLHTAAPAPLGPLLAQLAGLLDGGVMADLNAFIAAPARLAADDASPLGAFLARVAALTAVRRPVTVRAGGDAAAAALAGHEVVQRGMCEKKKVEARAMHPLVAAYARRHGCGTVLNVGEGKGYVSRLLAFAHGLQVVGLDCNPAHRDASSGRIDRMLDLLATETDVLYRPRGHLVSVACRIAPDTDWATVLRPHVALSEGNDSDEAHVVQAARSTVQAKVRCRNCQKVLKREVTLLLQHARTCLGDACKLTEAECAALPLAAVEERLVGLHYDVFEPRRTAHARGVRVRVKREREADENDDVFVVLSHDGGTDTYKARRVGAPATAPLVPIHHDTVEALPLVPAAAPPVSPDFSGCVMMGLHACGDLGAEVCRTFARSKAAALVLVSCCWHALTSNGFPLSAQFKEADLPATALTFMLATQPVDRYGGEGTAAAHVASLRLMFMRAQLRAVAPEHPALQPAFLRGMAKRKHDLTFADFAREASAAHGGFEVDLAAAEAALGADPEMAFRRFVAFSMLRTWLAPLVEVALLADRCLYLRQGLPHGSAVSLVPVFDPAVSPRFYAILAERPVPQ